MLHWETMWTFHTRRFSVSWQIAPDDDLDLSWDDDGSVQEGLNSGLYTAFVSRVVVYMDGHEMGADYLGGSVYENPADFGRDHRSSDPMNRNCTIMRAKNGNNTVICHYFPGMVRQAIAETRQILTNVPKLHMV